MLLRVRAVALLVTLAILFATPRILHAQAIPLDQVRVVAGAGEVLTFPVTAQITEFGMLPGRLHIRYTTQGQWPPIDIGGALQEATVWFFANINGEWVAAGMERLRPNQIDKPEGDDPTGFIPGFIEGRDFGPFNGYAFRAGEPLGVLVAAGSSRFDATFLVRERTRLIVVPYPSNVGVSGPPFLWTEGEPDPGPGPGPDPTPTPGPTPTPAPDVILGKLEEVLAAVQALDAKVDRVALEFQAHDDQNRDAILERLEQIRRDLSKSADGWLTKLLQALGAGAAGGLVGGAVK